MVTGQEFLFFQLICVQKMQYILSAAEECAASHGLKSKIQEQSTSLDELESQLQILSVQRGWDVPDLNSSRNRLIAFRLKRRNDSGIAEYLIHFYMDCTISMMKYCNRWDPDDRSVRILFQKVTDCCTVGIRQMELFL